MPNVGADVGAVGEVLVWSWSVAESGRVAPMSEAAASHSIDSLTETGEAVVDSNSAGRSFGVFKSTW